MRRVPVIARDGAELRPFRPARNESAMRAPRKSGIRMWRVGIAFAAAGFVLAGTAVVCAEEEKKPDTAKKDPPQVMMTVPLAVAPGTLSTVRLRGLKLGDVSEVRLSGARHADRIKATVKSKAKAFMPERFDAKRVGDTQADVELTLPADLPPGPLSLTAVTPAGESKPYTLFVLDAASLTDEKEPNAGFRQAQELSLASWPKAVRGEMNDKQDVDVYRFAGRAGQLLTADVLAARCGSGLDGTLTLYDAAGHALATADDRPAAPGASTANDSSDKPDDAKAIPNGRSDPLLRFRFPKDGTYFLALADANDRGGGGQGGGASPYLLALKLGD